MIKKILKSISFVLLLLLFLFSFIEGGLIIAVGNIFLGNIIHIFNSIVISFSIIIMGIGLLKHKNTKVFLLGFSPVFICGFSIFMAYFFNSIIMIISGMLAYTGLMGQLLLLKKKNLCMLISLLFIPFLIYATPIYLCEEKNAEIQDVIFEWNWNEKRCEERSTMPVSVLKKGNK